MNQHGEYMTNYGGVQWHTWPSSKFYHMGKGDSKHDSKEHKNNKVDHHCFEYVW